MQTVSGGAFPIELGGIGTFVTENDASRTITVRTQEALRIFQRYAVREADIFNDMLGLYSILNVGSDMKARFANFTPMFSPWRARKNGCVWNPGGKIRMNIDSIDTCPIEFDGEECPDTFYNDCFERIFNSGMGVRDLLGTPEGLAIVEEILRAVYIGLGNGYSELVWAANHPLISEVNTSGKYSAEAERWAGYFAQQTDTTCAGFLTLLDALHERGEKGHDLQIPAAEINPAGAYTGDINALLQKLVANSGSELRTGAKYGFGSGTNRRRPIILLSDSLYTAYKNYLHATYTHIQEMFEYKIMAESGMFPMPGVLKYEGMPVVSWDQVSHFDELVGTKSHRAALIAPGTLGVAASVDKNRQQQFQGMGLVMDQPKALHYKGKLFMSTTTRWGTGLADKALVSQAQYIQKQV
jgi:hypothetical protein